MRLIPKGVSYAPVRSSLGVQLPSKRQTSEKDSTSRKKQVILTDQAGLKQDKGYTIHQPNSEP